MKKDFLKEDIKLIAFDMDGTILNDNKNISEYTIKVLNKAAEQGVTLVPITGRPLLAVLPFISEIKGINYVASSNGAVITDVKNNTVIKEYPLSKEIAVAVYDLAVSLGERPILLINGCFFKEKGTKSFKNTIALKASKFQKELDTYILKHGLRETILAMEYPIEKMIIFFDSAEEKYKALKEFQKIEGTMISYAFDINLEINALGVNKGNALEAIADICNISLKNTMAIGDGANDMTMIERAGVGVVMGNALKELKGYGDYITLSNNNDGAAKAIERFIFKDYI